MMTIKEFEEVQKILNEYKKAKEALNVVGNYDATAYLSVASHHNNNTKNFKRVDLVIEHMGLVVEIIKNEVASLKEELAQKGIEC